MYTGGVRVAKIVAQAAAEHLTPTMLELGGKNPCVVDHTAQIQVTARRIVFGKFLNCGQTCIAPDYILVHESVKESVNCRNDCMRYKRVTEMNESKSDDYGHIINTHHFDRLQNVTRSPAHSDTAVKPSPKTDTYSRR